MSDVAVILPGYLAGSADYFAMADYLNRQGVKATVVPLQWWEWLPTVGGRSVVPILDRLHQTVQQVRDRYQTDKVTLIGHSAGGWIARIYLGEKPYYDRVWAAKHWVSHLVTLGTPHCSLEPWTKRNLGFVNENYPGAFHPEVRYVCVAGEAVKGEDSWLAYQSYKLTIGDGNSSGDGITPVAAAHLAGATNIVIPGASHSPKRPPWYGTEAVIDRWLPHLL
ncbi:MAG: lipase [Pseudanabaenaceae cyanobacterium SKYGB_i_bin29]|nr:alpha/beta hydrolase [Pseudanabaenaceae cyanobacterium SKYG29]MDW8421160.1 lipase [Pseudanabaenaceae cyanobacterium SKYGB_i_bin29]